MLIHFCGTCDSEVEHRRGLLVHSHSGRDRCFGDMSQRKEIASIGRSEEANQEMWLDG